MAQLAESVKFGEVKPRDPVFAERIRIWREATIPAVIEKTKETGRIDAFRLGWKEGMPRKPHIYWDSDVAKVLEGMAYALAHQPDPALEKLYDEWVDLIVSAQQPDGYLNTYFTAVEPENRWKNLAFDHELYCAGHLMEAAVAGYELLGKRKLLDALCRYADYIDSVFGPESEGKRRGWPGHEEIELALMKLFRATGNERYSALARYFINDRGTEPNLFTEEDRQEKQALGTPRTMTDAYGHAVRAIYLLSGMADVARLDKDEELLTACERVFENIRTRRMYITGGIGSLFAGEKFTADYDLPNGSVMYAESCAAMGLVLFAVRMFNITGNEKYMDVAERALYNGVPAGIGLTGTEFFYTNYLSMDEDTPLYNMGAKARQPWFFCSCCPTSFSRFLPQIGTFFISRRSNGISLNIPAACEAAFTLDDGTPVKLHVGGSYPWKGKIPVTVDTSGHFTLEIRIPDWCEKYAITLNGQPTGPCIERNWTAGDVVLLNLEMPPKWYRADSRAENDRGRVALCRGPVVYALEEQDQPCPVREIRIRTDKPVRIAPCPEGLPGGTVALTGEAYRVRLPEGALYTAEKPLREEVKFLAVPYALWQNRKENAMSVWIPET